MNTSWTTDSEEGYLILAMGTRRYLDMARNLAMSLKLLDPSRPICLVHDSNMPLLNTDADLFDHTAILEQEPELVGCTNKIRLFECSPYQRTMYVDADCLLVKKGIDFYWESFRGNYFNMTGEKTTTGKWYNIDIADVCSSLGINYVVKMNSGIFYFEKTDKARNFFLFMQEMHHHNRSYIGTLHRGIDGQYADEPFFGVAMGHFRIEPIETIPGVGSIMVTTYLSRNLVINIDLGVSYIEKAAEFMLYPHKLLVKRWVQHSPILVHFIDLLPNRQYLDAVSCFRRFFYNK